MEVRFAQLDARGLQGIDDIEQPSLPAHQLGTRLTAAAILIGQVA
jgi:hypothetical protein